jgi:Subtilisin inhibitor-like
MSGDGVACAVIWNQRKVVARPMAVINLRTRARFPRRPLLTAVVGVIATAGALAGCGTAATPSAGGAGSHGHAAKATLTIKVTDRATGKVTHSTLRCNPPGGTTPDPAAACKALFGSKNTFTQPRRHVMCPMIIVSGKQIVIDGTWFGKKVHRVIIDGECDLRIFNSLAKIFR